MRESALLGADQQPVTMCAMPTFDPFLVGPARLFQLADLALSDFKAEVGRSYQGLRIKLVVVLDEAFAVRLPNGEHRADTVGSELRRRVVAALQMDVKLETLSADTAGLGAALPKLGSELQRGDYDATIVLGVHSDYDPEHIASLSARGRIFSSEHKDALVPGEAAALFTLATPVVARRQRWPLRTELLSAAGAFEKATLDNDDSAFEAAAMTQAVRRAYQQANLSGLTFGWLLSDVSQEMFRLHEFQAVMARTQEFFGPPQAYDQPAQLLGHLGSATIPLHIVLAAQAWRHGYAPAPFALSITGSDSGARSALALAQGKR